MPQRYTFRIDEKEDQPGTWVMIVRQIPGITLTFQHQRFNTTKKLTMPADLQMGRDEMQQLIQQMVEWLTERYYDRLTDSDTELSPLSFQFAYAREQCGMTLEEIAAKVPCRLSRLRHIEKGVYNAINLDMFLRTLDVMGCKLVIQPKEKN